MIQFIQDPNNPCCYDLKILNNKTCSLRVQNIKFMISEINEYSETIITDQNFNEWDLTLQSNWIKSAPFYNNQSQYFKFINANSELIPPNSNPNVARFCLPEDGKIYKIAFFLETPYSSCKSNDFFVRCMPPPGTCCNNINVAYSIDNSQPDRCCYFLTFTNTNPNCKPSFYNVYDKKGVNLVDWDIIGKNEPYKENVPLGPFCVSGSGNHEIIVDILFFDGQNYTVCSKTISTVVCPTNDCCSKISVVPNSPTIGTNGDCCYTFNITSSDPNCIASLTITDPLTQIGVSLSNAFGSSVPASPICIASFSGNHNLLFDFTLSNNEHCYKNVSISCPDNCCANFSATVGNIATEFDHSDICCYPITYTIGSSVMCQASKIVVTGNNGKFLEKSIQGTSPGTYEDVICIDKELMIGQPNYILIVKFLAVDGSLICSYPSTVVPCTGTVEPCSPPLQQGESGEWTEERDVSVSFECPPNSGKYCWVEARYRVRHVINGTTSVHRDIQVTQYTLKNNSCTCTDAMVLSLLKGIISDEVNLIDFGILPDISWQLGDERTYENFRITTVDCWETAPIPPMDPAPSPIYTKKCNDAVCCYATYRIKIKKQLVGQNINYEVIEEQKLSESQIQINTCIPPCEPLNCEKWRQSGNGHAKLPINLEGKDDNNCKIVITNNINEEFPVITLDCELNGLTSIEIFDIKGNAIFDNEIIKITRSIELIINKKIISGIYLIKVTIDSKQVLFDKFNFIE